MIWTSLAFLLVASPYHYSEAVIGLFGLLGAAGALAATFSGRLADRGLERWVTGRLAGPHRRVDRPAWPSARIACGRWWSASCSPTSGIQAVHIQNQQLIFAIDPSARSRLNTGYMVTYFIGGAIGSAATGVAYGAGGWPAVIVLGAVLLRVPGWCCGQPARVLASRRRPPRHTSGARPPPT